MTDKKPNPIEEAIGERARDLKAQAKATKETLAEPIPLSNSRPSEIPDEPTPTEMLDLEELNRQTEERFQDQYPEEEYPQEPVAKITTPKSPIPVLKSDPPPETETCSPESPPQGIKGYDQAIDQTIDASSRAAFEITKDVTNENAIGALDELVKKEIPDVGGVMGPQPAEDIELTALRKFIYEEGFVVATVAFHIVALCSQPMVTPSTTTWDFVDRAIIPEMVFALLNQPGYLEGIWPSLKIIMGSNKGNASWCSGIATTMAFFDVIRTLPTLRKMQDETKP